MTEEVVDDPFADPPAVSVSNWDDIAAGPKVTEGRSSYTMPHPITGKQVKFMRASRFAQTLADQYMVTEWKIGMVTIGLSRNRGMTALANSMIIPEEPMEYRRKGWWMKWAEIGHKAMDYADSNNGSNLGIALHNWVESLDQGKIKVEDVLPDWQPHVEAYLDAHVAWGMKTESRYLERRIVNLAGLPRPNASANQYNGLCGRFDALRRMPDGSLMVDDTKTGKNAPEGLDEIALQLSVYANAEWIWNAATESYEPMPEEVRKDIATITWVPVNDPDNTQVIPIDIAAGWEAATELAAKALEWRARAKRKNNGIRLSTGALAATMAPSMGRLQPADYVVRLEACRSQDQISHIYMEASALGLWTKSLDAQAKMQRNKIKIESV